MHSSTGFAESTYVTASRTLTKADFRLVPFDSRQADTLAAWVKDYGELRWLAPSTPPPLTADKILGWQKVGGEALVAVQNPGAFPLAYGELNAMRHEADHFWLGHIIVDPALRGGGVGRRFVDGLLAWAFFRRAARKVSLIVFPENAAAVRCYLRAGFRCTGEERHRFAAGGPLHRLLRFEIQARRVSRRAADEMQSRLAWSPRNPT